MNDSLSSPQRVRASPLARRLANQRGIDLASLAGSGFGGRIVKADIGISTSRAAPASDPHPAVRRGSMPVVESAQTVEIPHTVEILNGTRQTIAKRLTESKQQVPHIYLSVDIRLDALLKLRTEINAGLATRGYKISVNDFMIKALAAALTEIPNCNVSFAGDTILKYSRADISVAVSIPNGLITPTVIGAESKSTSTISLEMKELVIRAKENRLKPQEYQGGTATLSNLGMFGIKRFEAVINPPHGMIMAVGAGEKRPYIVDDTLGVATVLSATGSFDHRAIDGAEGAKLMGAFRELVECPLLLLT